MEREELINDIMNHMKEYDYYNYQDAYSDDEDAYQDINRTLDKDGKGVMTFLIEDINSLLKYEDLRNEYEKKHFDDCINLSIKINEFSNHNKEIDTNNEL